MKHIEIIHGKKIMQLDENGNISLSGKKVYRHFMPVIKKKLGKKTNVLYLIFYSGFNSEKVKTLQNYIQSQSFIDTVYVFFEDVLRMHDLENADHCLDTSILERNPNFFDIPEIETARKILSVKDDLKVTFFCCEKNPTVIENRYNIKLNYFDWYLIESYYHLKSLDEQGICCNNDALKNKISCFNKRPESHRTIIAVLLSTFENCCVSINHKVEDKEIYYDYKLPFNKFSKNIQEKIYKNLADFNPKNFLLDGNKKQFKKHGLAFIDWDSQYKNTIPHIVESFVNVVTETRYYSPMPYISEKTTKPIMCKRPFIMLGPPGTLALLHELGFKTFSEWWDESYDNIENHNERLEAVFDICEKINSMDWNMIQALLSDMQSVLEHNYQRLHKIESIMLSYIPKIKKH